MVIFGSTRENSLDVGSTSRIYCSMMLVSSPQILHSSLNRIAPLYAAEMTQSRFPSVVYDEPEKTTSTKSARRKEI